MQSFPLRTRFDCRFAGAILLVLLAGVSPTRGQAISDTSVQPFVVGLVPVIGNSGRVGGISIDAAGAVSRSDVETGGSLRDARLKALAVIDSDINAASPLRKISLRRLSAALQEKITARKAPGSDLQNLAGLTRVEYVFVYPEHNDIILAGPAEGWRIDDQGNSVGQTSGQPTLQLDDLLIALRTAKAAAMDRGISCSIDPTEEGLHRLKPLLHARNLNAAAVDRMEKALGPQRVTITGVPPGSHFAQVLVASDFLMKRLGMNFEPAPIDDLPSYMKLLASRSAPLPKSAMPRWWMAPHYEPLRKDAAGRAWQIRGSGVQTLTEEGYLSSAGAVVNAGRADPTAKKWADAMTTNFQALSKVFPVFGELRNCMDLAVVAALLVKEDLPTAAACDLSLLLDEKRLAVAEYQIPKTIDSRASLIRRGPDWILSLSGGIQIDSWSVLNHVETKADLTATRQSAIPPSTTRWWWD
ncbi:MAG TPA: DUF1598 domain-containing protein [Pirellulaceae bacterium]|jgi:hypothetical protein